MTDDLPQECRDQAGDVVIGYVPKSARMAFEVRLRTITKQRFVLARICRKDAEGVWRPTADNARCGLSIRASLLTAFVDLLERAEDVLDDEGQLP